MAAGPTRSRLADPLGAREIASFMIISNYWSIDTELDLPIGVKCIMCRSTNNEVDDGWAASRVRSR
jgi:hypothetical protein